MANLQAESQEALNIWYRYIRRNNYSGAKQILNKYIRKYKRILANPKENEVTHNSALILGIFYKGLEEFTDLYHFTRHQEWIKNYKNVEKIWYLLQNCKERLRFVNKYLKIDEEIVSFISDLLNHIDKNILEAYGPGYYNSPELLIKSSICSICGKDYRTCPHISNEIYGGKICQRVVTDLEIKACSLVEHPEDLRCRIWPWNAEKSNEGLLIKDCTILTPFNIQEF